MSTDSNVEKPKITDDAMIKIIKNISKDFQAVIDKIKNLYDTSKAQTEKAATTEYKPILELVAPINAPNYQINQKNFTKYNNYTDQNYFP